MININIKDKLVIIIPPGCYSCIEYPRRSCGDYNGDIESKSDKIIESERIKIKKSDREKS